MDWLRLVADILRAAVRRDRKDSKASGARQKTAQETDDAARRARETAERMEGRP